jgi:hypothetical protein
MHDGHVLSGFQRLTDSLDSSIVDQDVGWGMIRVPSDTRTCRITKSPLAMCGWEDRLARAVITTATDRFRCDISLSNMD